MGLSGLFPMIVCICVAFVVVLTLRKTAPGPEKLPATPNWIDDLSTERYRPMLRLLDGDDFQVLRSQPGCGRELIVRMRRQRCEIFRKYLQSLEEDFCQVCLALKLLMVHANQDRRDLATVLIRSRLQFAWGLAQVRLRLALYRCGVGTVDAGNLLRTLGHLQEELRSLIPSVALGA